MPKVPLYSPSGQTGALPFQPQHLDRRGTYGESIVAGVERVGSVIDAIGKNLQAEARQNDALVVKERMKQLEAWDSQARANIDQALPDKLEEIVKTTFEERSKYRNSLLEGLDQRTARFVDVNLKDYDISFGDYARRSSFKKMSEAEANTNKLLLAGNAQQLQTLSMSPEDISVETLLPENVKRLYDREDSTGDLLERTVASGEVPPAPDKPITQMDRALSLIKKRGDIAASTAIKTMGAKGAEVARDMAESEGYAMFAGGLLENAKVEVAKDFIDKYASKIGPEALARLKDGIQTKEISGQVAKDLATSADGLNDLDEVKLLQRQKDFAKSVDNDPAAIHKYNNQLRELRGQYDQAFNEKLDKYYSALSLAIESTKATSPDQLSKPQQDMLKTLGVKRNADQARSYEGLMNMFAFNIRAQRGDLGGSKEDQMALDKYAKEKILAERSYGAMTRRFFKAPTPEEFVADAVALGASPQAGYDAYNAMLPILDKLSKVQDAHGTQLNLDTKSLATQYNINKPQQIDRLERIMATVYNNATDWSTGKVDMDKVAAQKAWLQQKDPKNEDQSNLQALMRESETRKKWAEDTNKKTVEAHTKAVSSKTFEQWRDEYQKTNPAAYDAAAKTPGMLETIYNKYHTRPQ